MASDATKDPQMEPKVAARFSKVPPGSAQGSPKERKNEARGDQDDSRGPQETRRGPGAPKSCSRSSQGHFWRKNNVIKESVIYKQSRNPKKPSRGSQEAPTGATEAPKTHQDTPRRHPRRPLRAPRRTKHRRIPLRFALFSSSLFSKGIRWTEVRPQAS